MNNTDKISEIKYAVQISISEIAKLSKARQNTYYYSKKEYSTYSNVSRTADWSTLDFKYFINTFPMRLIKLLQAFQIL